MSQRPHQYPDPWAGVSSNRREDSREYQRSYPGTASSPPTQAYGELRYSPYPASSRSSSNHYDDQPYPPGYIGQERRLGKAPYGSRELPRTAARPLFGPAQHLENEAYQPPFAHPYRPSPLDTGHSYVRHSSGFGFEDPSSDPPLHRRPSSLQNYETSFSTRARVSPTHSLWGTEYAHEPSSDHSTTLPKSHTRQPSSPSTSYPPSRHGSSAQKPHHTQKRSNRDEFDGPTQYLPRPSSSSTFTAASPSSSSPLPSMPITLSLNEQDSVLSEVNALLSQCAFTFIAKYNFPIPLEPGKALVKSPSDREWSEWAHLLKRLATKRRIPARLLYEGQIKQMVTVLENSLGVRGGGGYGMEAKGGAGKDDWNVLQFVSAGVQVAKLLKDGEVRGGLEELYRRTERVMGERKGEGAGKGKEGVLDGGGRGGGWGSV